MFLGSSPNAIASAHFSSIHISYKQNMIAEVALNIQLLTSSKSILYLEAPLAAPLDISSQLIIKMRAHIRHTEE
jgi:hypothetical protein